MTPAAHNGPAESRAGRRRPRTNPEPGRILVNLESHDVRGDFERLKAAGATVIREPYEYEGQPGSTIATFSDPDGNYFQLMSPMPMPEIGD